MTHRVSTGEVAGLCAKLARGLTLGMTAISSSWAAPASAYASRAAGTPHHLFNPTPRAEMRELSTDRPDMTESPYSVDPGHVQVEMDVGVATHDRAGDTQTDGLNVAASNIKIGLLPRADLQIVLTPLMVQRTRGGGAKSSTQLGFGDTTLRLKVNVFGNDGGNVALGLLPFVSVPTASRRALRAPRTEYGLAAPLAAALPYDIGLGAMAQVQLVVGTSSRYVPQFVETFTLSHDLVGALAGFAEVASVTLVDDGAHPNFEVHGGLTLAVGDSVQVDCGAFANIAGPGDDLLAFGGLTFRR